MEQIAAWKVRVDRWRGLELRSGIRLQLSNSWGGMNGRLAREQRGRALFQPSDPHMGDIRAQLFGDRFKGGWGYRDPAYMPLFPHEYAEYVYSQGTKMWDKFHSCEELEAYVDQAPVWALLGHDDRSERWYDDSARLSAKWILGRLRGVPQDAQLAVTFWSEMESIFPHLATINLSTAQKVWVRGACLRILDADRAEGRT